METNLEEKENKNLIKKFNIKLIIGIILFSLAFICFAYCFYVLISVVIPQASWQKAVELFFNIIFATITYIIGLICIIISLILFLKTKTEKYYKVKNIFKILSIIILIVYVIILIFFLIYTGINNANSN